MVIFTSHQSLSLLVLAKVLAHWLTTGISLIALAPILALMLHLPAAAYPALMLSLLLGTPLMSLAGGDWRGPDGKGSERWRPADTVVIAFVYTCFNIWHWRRAVCY